MINFFWRVFFCCLLGGASYWILGLLGKEIGSLRIALTILFLSPLAAQMFSPYLIELFPFIARRARHLALQSSQGKYYAFEGNPIRFFLVDGEIWVPHQDVSFILTPKPSERELRWLGAQFGMIVGCRMPGFSEDGLMRLLDSRLKGRKNRQDIVKFRHWLKKDAFPNLHRLPGSATGSFETAVSPGFSASDESTS